MAWSSFNAQPPLHEVGELLIQEEGVKTNLWMDPYLQRQLGVLLHDHLLLCGEHQGLLGCVAGLVGDGGGLLRDLITGEGGETECY